MPPAIGSSSPSPDFDQSSLDAITSDPNAPAKLSAALISAVAAKNLDGVNFDFEG